MQLKDPSTGFEVSVTAWSSLWAFLFGIFYYAFKGLWKHAAIYAALAALGVLLLRDAFLLVAFPTWIGYGLMAPTLVRSHYLRKGWRPVGEQAAAQVSREFGINVQSASERECPFCAEPIQRKAIKCKHCGSDVSQSAERPGAQRVTRDFGIGLGDGEFRG